MKNEALQAFISKSDNKNSRYVVTAKKTQGKFIYTCTKEYLEHGHHEKAKVYAQNITDKLVEVSENAVRVIEKNSKRCIDELHLMFFEDPMSNLWLMGSRFCKASNLLVPQENTPIKRAQSQQRLHNDHSLLRSTLMNTTKSWQKRIGTASIGQKPNGAKKCPGDFCNFIVTSQTLSSKQEIDYDDLLQKVRSTYFSGKEKDLEKVKYSIRVDNLIEHRSRSKDKNIRKLIPYRLILLGKKIIIDKKTELVEVDIGQFRNCFNDSLDNEQENLNACASQVPYHFYDFVKVCDRCYEVYTLFDSSKRKASVSALKMENIRSMTSASPLKYMNPSRRGSSGSSSRITSPLKNNYLGSTQKDNINELLDDMGNALFELKYGDKIVKLKIADDYNRAISRQRAQMQSKGEKRKIPLETVKAEVFDHDVLTSQLFPDAKYFMKIKPSSKNRHDEYLQKLKEMSFSRGKLHHFREKVVKNL